MQVCKECARLPCARQVCLGGTLWFQPLFNPLRALKVPCVTSCYKKVQVVFTLREQKPRCLGKLHDLRGHIVRTPRKQHLGQHTACIKADHLMCLCVAFLLQGVPYVFMLCTAANQHCADVSMHCTCVQTARIGLLSDITGSEGSSQ